MEGTKYIVGEGPLLAQLRRTYNREVDAGRIVFFGEQKGADLAALYAEADVFVFPSLTDTFGNVILEALASGVPVAAYPVPGPVDILCHRNLGALHADLGVVIRQALARGRSDACRAYAQRFTWQAATDQFLQAVVPVGSMGSKQPIAPARASLYQQLNHI
jgi:glycosyltransferase involved in cell wall biosynthesis